MKIKFAALLFLSCAVLFGAEKDSSLDSALRYEVAIEFDSAEDANKATLEFLPLPEGKRVAFSTRWDDSNQKHVRMAEVLTRYGFRGTFFLNRAGQKFYDETLPKLLVDGHSIGNHTLNHPNLAAVIPNELGRQILQNRVEFEARSNQEINSFVLPYCAYKSAGDPEAPLRIGEALRRSGELGSPEYFQGLEKEYGMRPGSWAVSMLFGIDDRKPDFDLFEREVAKRLKKLETQPVVHMTLGLHTWQDDKGFETLARCFEKYGNRADWWYCNENEYISYYYIYHNTKVISKKVEGNKAIFTLGQALPAMTGANVPLWAKVTPAAKGGVAMVALERPDLRPEKIDALFIEKDEKQSSKKFPGLFASLNYDEKEQLLQLALFNDTGKRISSVSATYRLPLLFNSFNGVHQATLSDLELKHNVSSSLSIAGGMRNSPLYLAGELFFAVEVNFTMNGKSQRLWVCTSHKQPFEAEAVPRDKAMGYGPFEAGSFDPAKAEWSPMKNPATLLPGFVKIPWHDKKEYAIRLKVRADQAAEYPLHVSVKEIKVLSLNGENLELKPFPKKITLQQGSNEVILVFSGRGEKQLSISKDGNPNQPLPFE